MARQLGYGGLANTGPGDYTGKEAASGAAEDVGVFSHQMHRRRRGHRMASIQRHVPEWMWAWLMSWL